MFRPRPYVPQKKRVFVSFAVEDKRYRDLLRGQSRLNRSPIEFIDFSVKTPWTNAWKTQCRQRIKGCDGMVALLSRSTRNAAGARWEIECAVEEGIPVLGVHVHQGDRYVPPEIGRNQTISWTWDGVANFINRLR